MSSGTRQRKGFDPSDAATGTTDGPNSSTGTQRDPSAPTIWGALSQLSTFVAGKYNLQGPYSGKQVLVLVIAAVLLGVLASTLVSMLLAGLGSILGLGGSLLGLGTASLGWRVVRRILQACGVGYTVPTVWSMRKLGSMFGIPPQACDGLTQCAHAYGAKLGIPAPFLPTQ